MLRQWKSVEKRRGYRERMYRRTDVVKKAGQRQFCSSSSSSDLIARFQDTDGMPRAGNFNRCR
jgi:hypothetical protein